MNSTLRQKILDKQANVALIGLGYVGLPIAMEIAKASFTVYGIDISKERITTLKNGKSYIRDIKDEEINKLINQNFFVGDTFSVLSKADVIIICVPTPLRETGDPDLSFINSAVNKIIQFMTKETFIILESTVYPGATEELITKKIEDALNFKVGRDFFVCFSPERIDPNNQRFTVKNTPKIIGGATQACLKLGKALYSSFIEKVIPVSSTQVAEMTKLLENSFRSINIAFINELTKVCEKMRINIWEVIEAASTKPFGYMPFYPGPGVGGHCIPVDPAYLSWKARKFGCYNHFIELTEEMNRSMPQYVVTQLTNLLNTRGKPVKGANILILGVAYKKDIQDTRESPALEVMKELMNQGALVEYHDPYVQKLQLNGLTISSQPIATEQLKRTDLVVIIADHSNIDYQFIIDNSDMVYDTRNVTKNYQNKNVFLLGG